MFWMGVAFSWLYLYMRGVGVLLYFRGYRCGTPNAELDTYILEDWYVHCSRYFLQTISKRHENPSLECRAQLSLYRASIFPLHVWYWAHGLRLVTSA
jgi:hypothetical protein